MSGDGRRRVRKSSKRASARQNRVAVAQAGFVRSTRSPALTWSPLRDRPWSATTQSGPTRSSSSVQHASTYLVLVEAHVAAVRAPDRDARALIAEREQALLAAGRAIGQKRRPVARRGQLRLQLRGATRLMAGDGVLHG